MAEQREQTIERLVKDRVFWDKWVASKVTTEQQFRQALELAYDAGVASLAPKEPTAPTEEKLGTCDTPHFLGSVTADRRELLQTPHEKHISCWNWTEEKK